ncbi:MAG: hypothetical protein ACYDIA_19850 [Candidatus Humimicrobiaceae bacterium]
MNEKNKRNIISRILEEFNGILRLKPEFVPRKNFRSSKLLGLAEDKYNIGTRGEITERWISSTTLAGNEAAPEDEGLSYVFSEKYPETMITLKDIIKNETELVLGSEYSKKYKDVEVLAKILAYKDRIYFHFHQMQKDALLVKSSSKEEAYYFPENTDLGQNPETYFGFHPFIVEQKKHDLILNELINWESDRILGYSRAYRQQHDDGFHLPAGIPHSPGTALTIEIQEASDVFGNLQALYNNKILSKDTLFHSIREQDRLKHKEKIILTQLDWEKSADPYFYENRHTPPLLINDNNKKEFLEHWIFYNTNKFSGKKLTVLPHKTFISKERGAYSVLVWKGKGKFDGIDIEAQNFNYDELFLTYERAVKPHVIENNSNEILQIFKFFGPDINKDIPLLPVFKSF